MKSTRTLRRLNAPIRSFVVARFRSSAFAVLPSLSCGASRLTRFTPWLQERGCFLVLRADAGGNRSSDAGGLHVPNSRTRGDVGNRPKMNPLGRSQ